MMSKRYGLRKCTYSEDDVYEVGTEECTYSEDDVYKVGTEEVYLQ